MDKVGILYHPKMPEAEALAGELHSLASPHVGEVWVAAAWDEQAVKDNVAGSDLLISIGGDGTILRAARASVPHDILLLGVNLGRLGFLTELRGEEARERVPEILADSKWTVEERGILHAQVLAARGGRVVMGEQPYLHALNDLVVGRPALGRTIVASAYIDGELVADYRADGILVATATGSTAYCQAIGGPILHPESKEMVLAPIAPHLGQTNALVLPPTAVVELVLDPDQQAVFSLDGEATVGLAPGQAVRVTMSHHVARFIRLPQEPGFYQRVAVRLRWRRTPDPNEKEAR
ncbi:MAG: NAD(+)/NADH kinase [Dehalococcoidia bacterium]|nr:NAD(+)/NADH kinase [Dehalococcoidia bacterium]